MIPQDALIVSSHTDNSSALISTTSTEKCFLGLNMGFATPVGLGLALALPHRKVVVLDADGGVLLLSSALSDLAAESPSNLIVVVGDNESALRFPTHSANKADIAAMAKAAGIPRSLTVKTLQEFKAEFSKALKADELTYMVAKTEVGRVRVPEGVRKPFLWENKFEFVRHVEKTEGISIMKPSGGMGS